MHNLIIKKRIDTLSFGVWKWEKSDHAIPLSFQLDGARSQIYVEEETRHRNFLEMTMYLQFVLIFENAPHSYIAALKSRGEKSTQFARRIYDYFIETLTRFEALLRVSGKVRNLMSMGIPSIQGFFGVRGYGWREQVTWQLDDQVPQEFSPKISGKPRKKNPLFKHPQLITLEKWRRMQRDIDANRLPSEDIMELYRLAGKIYPREKRIPVVEAAILIERKLRAYAETILVESGFSKTKIKDLKDELTFNTVLNLILPLTLSKSDLKRLSIWLPRVDRIRKLRNDIVHNELLDQSITEKEVLEGIYAAIDLFAFIDNKVKK
jgi:hypothetical protein